MAVLLSQHVAKSMADDDPLQRLVYLRSIVERFGLETLKPLVRACEALAPAAGAFLDVAVFGQFKAGKSSLLNAAPWHRPAAGRRSAGDNRSHATDCGSLLSRACDALGWFSGSCRSSVDCRFRLRGQQSAQPAARSGGRHIDARAGRLAGFAARRYAGPGQRVRPQHANHERLAAQRCRGARGGERRPTAF